MFIGQLEKDVWSGFANLMADLIEKYASVIDVENLPDKDTENFTEESLSTIESKDVA